MKEKVCGSQLHEDGFSGQLCSLFLVTPLLQKNFTIDPICKNFQIGQNICHMGFQI
jgi:hypothetical protein